MDVQLFRACDEPDLWRAALAVRSQVFIEEQGVPESEELDNHDVADETCIHALGRVGDIVAATGRLYQPGPGEGRIGRMAVLPPYRGCGIGSAILDALINEALRRRMRSLVLDAQIHAMAFYARRGFAVEGRIFLDCGIPHQAMRRRLE